MLSLVEAFLDFSAESLAHHTRDWSVSVLEFWSIGFSFECITHYSIIPILQSSNPRNTESLHFRQQVVRLRPNRAAPASDPPTTQFVSLKPSGVPAFRFVEAIYRYFSNFILQLRQRETQLCAGGKDHRPHTHGGIAATRDENNGDLDIALGQLLLQVKAA